MIGVLVRKLLRDLRVSGTIVALLLFAFQLLWARVTSRISEVLTAFRPFGVTVGAIRDIIFQGPGQVIQAIMGGEDIRIERAGDMMTVGYVHPLIVSVLCLWAVGRAAGAIAGEIDRGTMELLLAQPIRRRTVIAAHLIVDAIILPALALALWLGTCTGSAFLGAIGNEDPQLRIEPLRFLPALLMVGGLLFAVSGLTLWLSARARSQARVWGTAVTLLAAMFLINVLAQLWEPVAWLRYLTLFTYYQPQPLILDAGWFTHGIVWLRLGILYGFGSLGYALSAWTFCRRDLPAPV